MCQDSILDSVKEFIGYAPTYEVFDHELIMHINSVFSILYQLGVGDKPFRIHGRVETWSDFLGEAEDLEMVKDYVYKKVRLWHDPPTSSALLTALESQVSEFEWRCNVAVDPKR